MMKRNFNAPELDYFGYAASEIASEKKSWVPNTISDEVFLIEPTKQKLVATGCKDFARIQTTTNY